MTQQKTLELAKQGNFQAIAALINRSLQPKSINAKTSLKDGCLLIFVQAEKVPEPQDLVNFNPLLLLWWEKN